MALWSRTSIQKPSAISLPVDSLVQPANQAFGGHFEHAADSQQRRHGDGAASLDLLPVASRESARNHVFLRVIGSLSELLHPPSKGTKELGVVDHDSLCSRTRAETPRAD